MDFEDSIKKVAGLRDELEKCKEQASDKKLLYESYTAQVKGLEEKARETKQVGTSHTNERGRKPKKRGRARATRTPPTLQ